MGWMGLWWILIIAASAIAIWFVVGPGRRSGGQGGESPEQAVKRRYANGEIDRDTYERMLTDLRR